MKKLSIELKTRRVSSNLPGLTLGYTNICKIAIMAEGKKQTNDVMDTVSNITVVWFMSIDCTPPLARAAHSLVTIIVFNMPMITGGTKDKKTNFNTVCIILRMRTFVLLKGLSVTNFGTNVLYLMRAGN